MYYKIIFLLFVIIRPGACKEAPVCLQAEDIEGYLRANKARNKQLPFYYVIFAQHEYFEVLNFWRSS